MKYLSITIAIGLIVWSATIAAAGIIFEDNFDGYSDSPLNHGWSVMGSQVAATTTGGFKGTRGIEITYNSPGYGNFVFNKNIADLKLNGMYVRFYFKVDNPSGGSKFMKFFGVRNGDNYANTTFAINYFGSNLYEISYGDGQGISNDTASVIRYAGNVVSDDKVKVLVAKGPFDPRDGRWHCFETYMRYNNNDQRNGEYKVWIDGGLWVHATNVKNRNDLNSLFFDRVELGGYTHNNWSHTWHLWYDNVVFSDQYIGPVGSEPSSAPDSTKVQDFHVDPPPQ